MEAYRTPESDLTTNETQPYRPVKAILLGLTISVVLISIVSTITAVIFGLSVGIDFTQEGAFESLITTNTALLAIDVMFTAAGLFLTGIVVGKNTPGKENKFVIIVTLVTLLVYIAMFNASDSSLTYPLWYGLATLLVVPVAIYFGSESTKKLNN